MTDPIDQLLADLARLPDSRERLRRIAEARADVTKVEQRYVEARRAEILAARATLPRLKWREIGEIFGVSVQRAYKMAADKIPNSNERNTP